MHHPESQGQSSSLHATNIFARVQSSIKTSYPISPPSASAQDGIGTKQPTKLQASPRSPTFSTSSTFDGSGDGESSSPIIPPLPDPKLPERARDYLRGSTLTPIDFEGEDPGHYVTASWGSPYPQANREHLRRQSSSSETSDDSPIHQLAITTPFLRRAPLVSPTNQGHLHPANLSESAAVLVNRARRPVRGITEDWIRTHTTNNLTSEHRHWLSDGDYSEPSSLSGSNSGDETAWFEEAGPGTPRASRFLNQPSQHIRRASRRHPGKRSSTETLKQAVLTSREAQASEIMDNLNLDVGRTAKDAASIHTIESVSEVPSKLATPRAYRHENMNGSIHGPLDGTQLPANQPKPTKPVSETELIKKKLPWKGKSLLVHVPRDDERGQPGKGVVPLAPSAITAMMRSWEELGYNTRGFDLEGPVKSSEPLEDLSQSRGQWPDAKEIAVERSQHKYQVTLPDLNAWENYVKELQEAKLRALGVSSGDDDPAPPSISSAPSNLSRQTLNQYPLLPFSPSIPPSSAASTGLQGFPFPGAFHGASAAQSPTVPSVASPVSFNPPLSGHGKFNPRASISVSPNELPFHFSRQPSPHGWSPQSMVFQQHLARGGSPSISHRNSLVSPISPFQNENLPSPLGMHQRHQSLQYPMLPHHHLQRRDSARASPRLQDLGEVEEETQSNPYEESLSKNPEPVQVIKHNASASLQKEIDAAEYHLEEQFREQLEHEDYSPHNESKPVEAANVPLPLHTRGVSVHFDGNAGTDSNDGPVLHHPQPHSRGHSLSQKPFVDSDDVRDSTDEGKVKKPQDLKLSVGNESFEVVTNPSNLGTPIGMFETANKTHQRNFSMTSNPYDTGSLNGSKVPSRRPSLTSKSSSSKLNAGASEFKFNPASRSTFTHGQFNFGAGSVSTFQPSASTFQPASFQASFVANPPHSATSSHFSIPSTSSSSRAKINVAAPVFSPGNSDFSFTGKSEFNFVPKFNPEASAFQPLSSVPPSITSAAASGNESASNRPTSIFSNIDMNLSDSVKPGRKSKAIPIMRPPSRQSTANPTPTIEEVDQDGRLTDTNRRSKRFRETINDGDDVPRFAEPEPSTEKYRARHDEPEDEDESAAVGDTTMASTVLSESTDGKLPSESNDTKATTSPSANSPDQDKANWQPFEFSRESEMQDFNNARPFDDDEPLFVKAHKKSLSAAAKPFVPGGFMFGSQTPVESSLDPVLKTQPPPMTEPEESDDDRAASPTPRPEPRPVADAVAEPVSASSPEPVPAPVQAGLGMSRFATPPAPQGFGVSGFALPPTKPAGLAASRFAVPPSSVSEDEAVETPETEGVDADEPSELRSFNDSIPLPVSSPSVAAYEHAKTGEREPTFEEIDATMQQLNDDPTVGVNRTVEYPKWHQPSPVRNLDLTAVTQSPQSQSRKDTTLPSEPAPPMPSTELEDPFIDPPRSAVSQNLGPAVQCLNVGERLPESEWDDAFSASEQGKLEQRVNYFDGHIDELVGNALASRLDPLEKTLGSIQHVLATLSRRTPSSRRDRDWRSISAEIQESDADDEDDDLPPARRSTSPRKDKRMEQIRFTVMEAMNQHQATHALQPPVIEQAKQPVAVEASAILKTLDAMKEEFGQSLRLDFRAEDLRNIVEEAVERRMPPTPPPQAIIKDDEEATKAMADLQNRIIELEQRLRDEEGKRYDKVGNLEQRLKVEEEKVENETTVRRGAEDRAAELRRQLEQAETKIEVEIMNRSVYDQRVHDLEDRLKLQEDKTELELNSRREAEDRLSEVLRLLRISSEEEDRLRSVLEEQDQKVKTIEQSASKDTMRLALLEAAQANASQTQAELTNRLNAAEEELHTARNETHHWRSEAEHARVASRRQTDDFVQAVDETKHLRKVIDTLGTQLEETERIRDAWRKKFASLQDDMAHAAREITEENSRRIKKEQVLLARQEVLEARLQAESRTRERLETELERLEGGERAGMRAVSECQRLEGVLSELQNENHKIQQNSLHFQREFQQARESAASEIQRARTSVQAELETANEQVNIIRAELEEEVNKLRSQLDQTRLDADTAKAHHEMMLEEAQTSKKSDREELVRKHQNDVEDLQARYERQIDNTTEDAQRAEQNLLERLSLSTSKTEHLQDRVAHLEDKLQIAQEAARAAVLAAMSAGAFEPAAPHAAAVTKPATAAEATQLPEKISPQALRESIMVLQEQLQARERRIEELEQTVAKLDPEAPMKISKRDDEITWLRELLAVRHGDLQDIIGALSAEDFNKEAVKDAAIRLNANLQMEEQERERAMNGGSAINLPNIAATIRDAASPRVAQAVSPFAAAWGNWRKASQPALSNLSSVLSSPAPGRNATPSRPRPTRSPASQSSFLSGLMTPPASELRNSPPADQNMSQPTAFGNTGRRYTAEQFANRSRGTSLTSRQAEKMPGDSTPPQRNPDRRELVTPPMMRSGGYDADAAHIDEFDDAGFFDD